MQRLLELREFCESLPLRQYPQIAPLLLSPNEWDAVQCITSTLGHFANLTTIMQKEEISLSDFFGGWAKVKLEMTKLGNDTLAQRLLNEMKLREPVLFNNKVLNAAVFLDPRYQQYMPQANKDKAITFLSNLHKKLASLKQSNNDVHLPTPESIELEEFLNSMYGQIETESEGNNNKPESASENIETILQKFMGTKEPLTTSVFNYWQTNVEIKPELYKLAAVIHSVPPTQTTVERAFSAMALILSPLRTRLSDKNLENILLIRLNREIFKEIFPFELEL